MLGRFSRNSNLGRRAAIGAAVAAAGLLCTVQGAAAYGAVGGSATVTTVSPAVVPGGTFTVTAKFLLANGQPNSAIQGVQFVMTCVPASAPVTVATTTNASGVATAIFTAPSHNGACTIVATAADGTVSQTKIRVGPSANAGLVPGGPGNTGGGGGTPSGMPIAADVTIGALILLAGGATIVVRKRLSTTS